MKRQLLIATWFVAVVSAAAGSSAQDLPRTAAEQSGPVEQVPAWIIQSLHQRGADTEQSRFSWAVGIFTGNLYKDPLQAEAVRRVFSIWLNRVAARGDTVTVAGVEHGVWSLSQTIPLQDGPDAARRVFDALPSSPQPGSRGGKNLEQAMVELARILPAGRTGRPVILILSNGYSQAIQAGPNSVDWPRRLRAEGYLPVAHEIFRLQIRTTPQEVYAFLAVPAGISAVPKAGQRAPAVPPGTWVPAAYAPWAAASVSPAVGTTGGRAAGPEMNGMELWIALAAAAIGIAGIAWFAAAASRARPRAQDAGGDLLEKMEEHARNIAASLGEEIQGVKDAIHKIRETMPPAAAQPQPDASAQELGQLRTQIETQRMQIQDWDDTAMAFLDAVQRALSMPGLSDDRREAWAKAGKDFAHYAARNGFDVIAPKAGEPFVEGLHKAVYGMPNGAEAPVIVRCIHWGYRRGNQIFRLADVEVAANGPTEEVHQ